MRRIMLSVFITALLLTSAPPDISAQVSQWLAWLYDSSAGQMVLVDNSGQVQAGLILPMPSGFEAYPAKVVVSHGGQYIAYTARGGNGLHQLFVYAPGEDAVKVIYDLPPLLADSLTLSGLPGHFNEVDSMIAVGYALENDEWEVSAIDIETGGRIHLLRNDGPTTPHLPPGSPAGLVPVIHRFLINDITYMLMPFDGSAAPPYLSYDWNAPGGNISPNPVYVTLDYDVLAATDEVILTDVTGAGSLLVFDPVSRTWWPFYRSEAAPLSRPRFVQNGERIMFSSGGGEGEQVYTIINRDGTPAAVLQALGADINSVYGLTDGYLYTLHDSAAEGVSRLMQANTRNGRRRLLWTSQPGEHFRVVWVSDRRIIPIGPFTPWAQADEPVPPG